MVAADATRTLLAALSLAVAACCLAQLAAGDTNGVYEPCSDARIQRGDGFTFGVVFAGYNTFFSGNTQLSPCDRRLNLAASGQLALFRPKVDEISLLTINTTTGFNAVSDPGLLACFEFLISCLESISLGRIRIPAELALCVLVEMWK